MALGFFVYDLIFILLATLLYGGALSAALRAHVMLSSWLPPAMAVFPAFLAGLAVLLLEVSILSSLCPRLRPGRYAMMKGAVFYGWVLRSALRRVLFVPGLKWFLFASNVFRFLALRGLGARIAFTTNMSSDVDLLDPSLLVAGPGATFGARCLVAGHFVEGGKLVLGPVTVGKDSLLSADVICAPSVEIGERVTIKGRAIISVGTRIGDGAQIGAAAFLDHHVTVAPNGVVANNAHVQPRTEVAAARQLGSS